MSTINPIMHPEEKAWNDLRTAASSRLRPGFAGRVLAAARGPGSGAWAALREAAAACLRPGFAARVLREARGAVMPSYASQFALSAATVVLCLAAVLFLVRGRSLRMSLDKLDRGLALIATCYEETLNATFPRSTSVNSQAFRRNAARLDPDAFPVANICAVNC